MAKSVYISCGNIAVANMFHAHSWSISPSIKQSDLVVFTGGEDVNPALYQQSCMKATQFNPQRDTRDIVSFKGAKKFDKPMVGICRGAQFLNVMCGGSLWQHVAGHTVTHQVIDEIENVYWRTSSTHHQMMIPTKEAFIIGRANVATYKTRRIKDGGAELSRTPAKKDWEDVEVCQYEKPDCLCFQGHPEYNDDTPTKAKFFYYLENYLMP